MNNYTTLYWITRLDALKEFSIFIGCLGILILIIHYLYPLMNELDKEDETAFYKNHKYKGVAGS